MNADHHKPEFVSVNPTRRLPAITDTDFDNFYLFESSSILKYLANKYLPENNTFYPRDSPDKTLLAD